MDIIKKNILSVICAIVALVALIASFWPMGGQYAQLRGELETRKGVFDTADRLLKKQRPIPTTTVDAADQSAEKPTLDVFPSRDVIDKGKAAIEQVRQESLEMFDSLVKLNEHKLLVEASLPSPSDVQIFQFVRDYKDEINNKIPNDILNAAMPPTQEDVQKEADALWKEKYATDNANSGTGGRAGGRQQGADKALQEQYQDEVDKLPEQMQRRVAQEKKMYIDPLALDASKAMDVSRPNADQIWYAQVGLWVQQDVAQSLAAANAQAKNLLEAPVKRLVKLDVLEQQNSGIVYVMDKSMSARAGSMGRGGAMMPGMMGMGGGGYSDSPSSGSSDVGGPIPKDYTLSPTGRITSPSNPLYDVVHYKLDLVVDAARLAQVLEELQRNKLVTVLRIDELSSVDAALDQSDGYYYGDQPVVRLSLLCEALFLRDWTVPLMPQRVKQDLGIQETTGGSGGGATASATYR